MSSTIPERKLACLACRQRKVACDRRRPKCGRCLKNSFDCQYKSRDHRPGLRAGYVAQLDERLVHLEKRVNELEGRQTHVPDSADIGEPRPATSSFETTPLPYNGDITQVTAPEQYDIAAMSESPQYAVSSSSDAHELLYNDVQLVWLSHYHPWFPILHRTSIGDASPTAGSGLNLAQRAITAVTIWNHPTLTWEQKQSRSDTLRQKVILDAMESMTLRSVQALLILSISYWGEGKWPQFCNLIAMCKRMSQQLGLATMAKPLQASFSSVEPNSTQGKVDQEEQVRAFWMTEMLDSVFSLGLTNNAYLPQIPVAATFPCSDTIWSRHDPFAEGIPHHLRPSSGFSLCISLCTAELDSVHQFLRESYNENDIEKCLEWQSAAQRLDERLTIWREEFVAAVFRLINAEYPQDPHAEMEPFIVLANCILNMAVIILLQARTPLPHGVETNHQAWSYANTRCIYACENMAAKIRRMTDESVKNCSPCLILPLFVAARFYIVHTKCLEADVSANLRSLAYSLHTCSQRWPLARMYECVIRTAVAEYRTPISESLLPIEFYDLRCSSMDITGSLQRWAERTQTFNSILE